MRKDCGRALTRRFGAGITRRRRVNVDKNGWIPVEERLPTTTKVVLVTCKKELFYLALFEKGAWWGAEDGMECSRYVDGYQPIAWQPLPEPYSA